MSVGSIEPQFYEVLLKGLEMSPGKLTARSVGSQPEWLRGGEGERKCLKILGSIPNRAIYFEMFFFFNYYFTFSTRIAKKY